jgi:hypothetical protein
LLDVVLGGLVLVVVRGVVREVPVDQCSAWSDSLTYTAVRIVKM